MNILLTGHCNKNCDFCLVPGRQEALRHMTIDDYEICLKFAETSGDLMLYLLGGEPTLHPQFDEMVERARAQRFRITLLSNFLFDAAIAQRLNSWSRDGVIADFLVNADFPEEYRNEDLRRFMANLARAPANLARVAVAITVRGIRPLATYDYLTDYYREFDVTRVRIALDVRMLWASVGRREVGMHYYQLVRRLSEHGFAVGAELCAVPRCIFTEYEHDYLRAHCAAYDGLTGCEPNLDVFPDLTASYCAARPANTVFRRPLSSFVSLEHARAYFRGLRNLLCVDVPEPCRNCPPDLRSECRLACLSRFDGVIPAPPEQKTLRVSAPPGVRVNSVLDRWHVWANSLGNGNTSFVINSIGMGILQAAWSGREPEEIASILTDRFDITKERALADVMVVLEKARGAVAIP